MANEPERPIEKLLRAAANKRRDLAGAPIELHSATRRVLQGEVVRKFPRDKSRPETYLQALARLWPRAAWGAGVLAVLTVLALVLVPSSNKREARLARNEPLREAAATEQLAPQLVAAPAAAPSESAVRADHPVFAEAVRAPASPDQTARQLGSQQAGSTKTEEMAQIIMGEKPVLTASPGKDAKETEQTTISSVAKALPALAGTEKPAATDELLDMSAKSPAKLPFTYQASAAATSPGTTTAISVNKNLLGSVANSSRQGNRLGNSQRFAQVRSEAKAESGFTDRVSPTQPVLASFQVEQSGPELRIVDGDGSVYSGFVQVADGTERLSSVNGEKPAAAQAGRAMAAKFDSQSIVSLSAIGRAGQTYFFRVAGTNLSLNKKVVFTGNLVAATTLTLVVQTTNAGAAGGALGGAQAAPAVQSSQPLQNSRISGKAVIGDRKEIKINAVPTGP